MGNFSDNSEMPALAKADRSRAGHPLALLTLCLAVLVAQLDTSVANLAAQPIGTYFHAGVGPLQWVIDAYNLVYAVLLLTGGLLADLKGRRRVFMLGIALFTAATLAAASAPSIAVLIGARAVAGLGAALLIPASLAIIRVIWRDPGERAYVLGIWAACNGLAFAIGPTVGGLLIQWFSWRSVFLIVVPVGIAALALAPSALPESADPQGRSFDARGQTLGALVLGGLVFAAIEAHTHALSAWLAGAAAVGAAVLFVKAQRRLGSAALVPLSIISSPAFNGAALAYVGMTFGMYGAIFLLPLTWQGSQGLSPSMAGLALIPMSLIYVVVSPFSGVLTRRFGVRPVMCGGAAIVGFALLALAAAAGRGSLLAEEGGLALTGIGLGFANGPLLAAAVGAVSAERSGTASALINVARMVGATIGVAALGAVFSIAHGGAQGLRWAIALGGIVQLAGAAYAMRAKA